MQLLIELLHLKEVDNVDGQVAPKTVYKTPTKNNITNVVTTQDGSVYLISDKNESKRIKSKSTGANEWMQHCFFVAPKFQMEANCVIHLVDNKGHKIGENSTLYLTYNDTAVAFWKLDDQRKPVALTWDDAFPNGKVAAGKQGTDPMYFEYTKTPTKGYLVVEFNEGNNNTIKDYRCGTAVTNVEDINEASEETLALFKK